MTATRDLRDDLLVMGRAPVPPPRASFVDALEARLTAIASGDADEGVDVHVDITPTPASLPGPRGRVGLAVAVALAVVCSTAGLAVVSSDRREARTATVETADAAAAGGGAVTAGTDAVADRLAERDELSGSGAPQAASPTASTRLGPDGIPSTTAQPLAGAAFDAFTEPGASASRPPATLALRGSGTPAYSFLEWDRYDGDDFVAYLVLRAASPDDPSWPDESGRTIMLMRIEDRDTTSYEAQGKVGTTPRFRIVAVDGQGDVVAMSGVFQADIGAGLDTPRDVGPPGAPEPPKP